MRALDVGEEVEDIIGCDLDLLGGGCCGCHDCGLFRVVVRLGDRFKMKNVWEKVGLGDFYFGFGC